MNKYQKRIALGFIAGMFGAVAATLKQKHDAL